ncbi:MAG: conjugal transfer protein TraF [Saccharospirillaceae bacterium]|nr:conjugal transfer protein TraF [Pseudomonadales bacterium]NRB79769.1 conjugal transfer protein TraF [Saccharospirillaceae bacterium]
MSSILKMSFRISLLLSCSTLITTALFAAPFASNDSASRAMGGTGVASSQTYASSYFNPSLLAADAESKGIGFMLPSATVAFDDSSRLLQASRDYFETSFDIFSNYDVETISTLISGEGDSSIVGSFDAVAIASADVATKITDHIADSANDQIAVNIDTEIANLIAANENLQANMSSMNSEIIRARVVASDAEAGLLQLSDRPLQASAGVSVAAALPSKKWGTAIFLHNDLLTGVKIDLSGDDTQILLDVIDDFQAMVEIASDVSLELSQVVVDTALLSQILVNPPAEASWSEAQWLAAATAEGLGGTELTDALLEMSNYADALAVQTGVVDTQVGVAQTESERLEAYEGAYISGGELTLTADNRPELVSSVSIVGANIAEMGISFARRFTINGSDFNVGITPKFQRLDMFDHTYIVEKLVDGSEIEAMQSDLVGYFEEHYTTTNTVNIDIGLSKDFTYKGNIRLGLVIKNLIAQTFKTDGGSSITIPTQIRVGVAHTARFTTFALDIDLTENEPLSFGEPTQYVALGAELNIFGHAKLRAGYRNNIAVQNGATISAGLAFTPFGIGVDVAGWFKPTNDVYEAVQDIGISAQLSAQF